MVKSPESCMGATCPGWLGKHLEPWRALGKVHWLWTLNCMGVGGRGVAHWMMGCLEGWNPGIEVEWAQTLSEGHVAISFSLCPLCLYSCLTCKNRRTFVSGPGVFLGGLCTSDWVLALASLAMVDCFTPCHTRKESIFFIQRLQNTLPVLLPFSFSPSFPSLLPLIFIGFLPFIKHYKDI